MESIRDKFIGDLLSKPPEKIASYWMLERIPHAFNNDLELYINWKHALAEAEYLLKRQSQHITRSVEQ